MHLRPLLALLLVFIAGCTQQSAVVQIQSIRDNVTNDPVSSADTFVRPEDLGPGEDGQYFEDVTSPIVIPIKAGKCIYILIEAEGYKDWEQAFCPSKAQNLPVNIKLVPVDTPLPGKQTG
jgi:hypothetical protein